MTVELIEAVAKALRDSTMKRHGLHRSVPASVEDARAALAAIEARGWAVVPVEPTNAMCTAAGDYDVGIWRVESAYRDMISARPRFTGETE